MKNNTNKKITWLVIFLITGILSGCTDWLQLQPEDSLTQDEYWQTKEDVEAVVMSAYQKLSFEDSKLFEFGEMRGDMLAETTESSNDQKDILGQILTQEQNIFNWEGFYKAINNANYVIEFAPGVIDRDPTFNQYLLDAYIAEALFIRSLSYFYLVRGYRDVPLVLSSSKSDNQDFFIEKSNENEVLDKIIADLKVAETTVISSYGDIRNNKSRATESSVQAVLADVYLWKENYDSCIYYCDKIIDQVDRFSLMPSLLWFENFSKGHSVESVFEFYFDETQKNSLFDLLAPKGTGEYKYMPSTLALSKLNYASEVIRGYGSYNPFGTEAVWKYIGQESSNSSTSIRSDRYSANFIVYRLADIKLMKAEALVEKDRLNEALTLVNEIRVRARVQQINDAGSKEVMRDIVLEERAVELAFEGKRWWDLLRMGRRNNYERMDDFIRIMTNGMPVVEKIVVENRLKNKDSWFFPIHVNELRSNYKLVQNPFYETEF